MKVTDLAILFIIITLPLSFMADIDAGNAEIALYKKTELNRMLDTAAEDGSACLVAVGGDKKVEINKEKAAEAFFNSLFLNLNIFEDDLARKKMEGYVPCLIAVDFDGYYVMNNQEFTNDEGYREMEMAWSPKKPFSYYDPGSGCVFGFTLSNYITIYDTFSDEFYQGTVDQLRAMSEFDTNRLIQDSTLFDQVRRRTIVECLRRDVNASINSHNNIARKFGITYHFTLPVISDEDWYKTVDDVGLLVFLQGIPIGVTGERYNNFALGGARIVKTPKYYAETDAATGIKYYHKEDCPLLVNNDTVFDSRAECARNGYLPCRQCNP